MQGVCIATQHNREENSAKSQMQHRKNTSMVLNPSSLILVMMCKMHLIFKLLILIFMIQKFGRIMTTHQ